MYNVAEWLIVTRRQALAKLSSLPIDYDVADGRTPATFYTEVSQFHLSELLFKQQWDLTSLVSSQFLQAPKVNWSKCVLDR